jgi:aspartyl-tRNA(Asn)/glutamyl-tRNA(Gln) amidotransferase subunit A
VDTLPDDPALLSLAEVADAIAQRRLSAVEVTQAVLDRIPAWQDRINCFIAPEPDAALARARWLDAELAAGRRLGPLHGVPLAHKDLFYREGAICTGGSEIRRHWRAPATATVLRRLDQAGAVDLGRLNMAEFAAGATGHNRWYGDCRNPWNPTYATGGSSSGSGAAVAARLAYGALGSDTGGSIRLPAAASGVLGLKPTYGRVSRYAAMPRSWTLDHVGPLARTAADCALLLGEIAGADPQDPTSSRRPVPDYRSALGGGIRGLRIGVFGAGHAAVDPPVERALESSRTLLRSLGAELRSVAPIDWSRHLDLTETIIKCEAAAMHADWMATRPQGYSAHVRTRMESGLLLPAPRYIQALSLRGPLLAEFLETAMAGIDVLLGPAIPVCLPTLSESDPDSPGSDVLERMARLSMFMRPFNLLGLPALSVPCGFTDDGLPVAFQAVGRPFAEATLLRLAQSWQEATDFHRRVPALPD